MNDKNIQSESIKFERVWAFKVADVHFHYTVVIFIVTTFSVGYYKMTLHKEKFLHKNN